MNKKIAIVIVIVIVLAGVAYLQSSDKQSSIVSEGGLFELVFEDYDGHTVSLADFARLPSPAAQANGGQAGQPMVVNSWATWCPFCREELLDFAAAQEQFENQVVIIAIGRAESRAQAKQYSDQLGVTDKVVFLLDPDDRFYRGIGGFTMPETLFLDAAGNTVHHKRGFMRLEEINEKIEDIL